MAKYLLTIFGVFFDKEIPEEKLEDLAKELNIIISSFRDENRPDIAVGKDIDAAISLAFASATEAADLKEILNRINDEFKKMMHTQILRNFSPVLVKVSDYIMENIIGRRIGQTVRIEEKPKYVFFVFEEEEEKLPGMPDLLREWLGTLLGKPSFQMCRIHEIAASPSMFLVGVHEIAYNYFMTGTILPIATMKSYKYYPWIVVADLRKMPEYAVDPAIKKDEGGLKDLLALLGIAIGGSLLGAFFSKK